MKYIGYFSILFLPYVLFAQTNIPDGFYGFSWNSSYNQTKNLMDGSCYGIYVLRTKMGIFKEDFPSEEIEQYITNFTKSCKIKKSKLSQSEYSAELWFFKNKYFGISIFYNAEIKKINDSELINIFTKQYGEPKNELQYTTGSITNFNLSTTEIIWENGTTHISLYIKHSSTYAGSIKLSSKEVELIAYSLSTANKIKNDFDNILKKIEQKKAQKIKEAKKGIRFK